MYYAWSSFSARWKVEKKSSQQEQEIAKRNLYAPCITGTRILPSIMRLRLRLCPPISMSVKKRQKQESIKHSTTALLHLIFMHQRPRRNKMVSLSHFQRKSQTKGSRLRLCPPQYALAAQQPPTAKSPHLKPRENENKIQVRRRHHINEQRNR